MVTIKCTLTFPDSKVVVITAESRCPEGDVPYHVNGDASLLKRSDFSGPMACLEPWAESIAKATGATLAVEEDGIYDAYAL